MNTYDKTCIHDKADGAGIEEEAEGDLEVRNCGDCKHYFYFVGEAGCELDGTSYPELCENFTPDDE